jgi:hypothetical protein
MKQMVQLFRPPRLCFLLARFAWTILALAAPVAIAACLGLLPAAFVLWSSIALPLAIVTVIWIRRSGYETYRGATAAFLVWVLLLLGVGGMALAGDRIDWSGRLTITLQSIYALAFLGVLAGVFAYLWKADARLRGENRTRSA